MTPEALARLHARTDERRVEAADGGIDLRRVLEDRHAVARFRAEQVAQLAGRQGRALNDLAAEIELVNEIGREFLLRQALAPLGEMYDYILVDCPPSLGLLTVNTLTAADSVIVPIQCEYFAMEGLAQMIDLIREVIDRGEHQLQFGGIVLTMLPTLAGAIIGA